MTKAVWKVPVRRASTISTAHGAPAPRRWAWDRLLHRGRTRPANGDHALDPSDRASPRGEATRERHPITVEADVMKPFPVDGPFDSAALSFVLHCLRGPEGNKAVAVRNIADVLSPEGSSSVGPSSVSRQPHEARARVPASRQPARGLRQPGRHCRWAPPHPEAVLQRRGCRCRRFCGPLRRGQATVPLLDAASIDSTLLGITGKLCGLVGSDVEDVVAAIDTHAHTLVQGDGAMDVLRVHAEPNLPHASARQLGEGATKQ